MKPIKACLLKSSAVLLLASALGAHADYRSTILSDSPSGYWRLDETNVNQICTNYGSGRSALNAYYDLGKFVPRAGAIAGDPDAAAAFDGAMSRVEIPYTPALNPAGAFSVEFWGLRTLASSAGSTYYAPIWSRGNASVNGYLFYVDPNNKWTFWMGTTNASGSKWINPTMSAAMVANTWYHVVGTYSPVVNAGVTNWYANLYVNGVLQATLQVNAAGGAYLPNSPAPTGTPYISPFRIGAGNYGIGASAPWPGYVDEVAFYTNALTDLQVSNHWAVGTNAARTVSYYSTIINDAPLAYWRLDETNTAIAYNQAPLGSVGNGVYEGSLTIPPSVDPVTGISINPSNYVGTMAPLAPGALTGGGDNNPAVNFFPPNVGSSTGAKVEVPYVPALNTKTFSVECWANLQSLGYTNSPISSRYVATGSWGGYEVLVDSTGKLQFWLGSGASSINKLIAANSVFATNTWNHIVAVYDGGYAYLYLNSELVGTMAVPPGYMPNPSNTLRIGGGASESVGGNFYVNGTVDEAAYYGYPLSRAQVASHYVAGHGSPAPVVNMPNFTVQPQGANAEYGGAFSMTAIAVGSLPIQYQWYKDGVLLAGQTNTTLSLSNVTDAATGTYELWATNTAGVSSASAYAQVNPPFGPSLFTDLPATTPYYPGASPTLRVVASGSLPLTYLWSSNNVRVAVTTVPALTLTNLPAAAAGTQYSVLVTNAFGSAPSSVTTLQALTPVAGDYVARAMALTPVSYWRLGDDPATTTAIDCSGGNHGQYVGVNQHFMPGALAVNDDGCGQFSTATYVQVPTTAPFSGYSTTNQFTLMAWIKPNAISGIQRVFSTRQFTPYAAGFAFGLTTNNLIFSAFGVADLTFSAGVTTGQWYHVAAVYSNKTVTCYVNGSVVGTARSTLNAIIPSASPLYISGNPTSSEWFGGLIDEAAIYGTALTGAQILDVFGTKPSITQAPASASGLAGSLVRFSILGSGQTPLIYQWRTNGTPMLNQTNTTLLFRHVPLGLNGLQLTCVITNSLGSITSSPVTLTVVQGSGYVGNVLADYPVAYWRLNEASGSTIRDYVDTHDGSTLNPAGLTYRPQDVLSPLAAGGDTDPFMGFNGTTGAVVVPYYPELNQSIYSIECWALDVGPDTDYRAPVTSRDSTNSSGAGYILYCGRTGVICGNMWQYWTGPAVNSWDWLCGTKDDHSYWTHLVATYDGTNKNLYVNGALTATKAIAVNPNQRRVMAIGASGTEAYPSLSGFWNGDLDEVAYYGYALAPEQVMSHYLLASYGTNQAPQVNPDLVPQEAFAGLPCSMTAGVVGSVPITYQWYKNGAPMPGRSGTSNTATNFFALTFPSVQASDAGTYKLVVHNGAGDANTSDAALTIVARPAITSAGFLPNGGGFQMKFSGPAGTGYRVWTSADPTLSPVETTWTLVGSGTFSGGADEFVDPQAVSVPSQFYVLTIP